MTVSEPVEGPHDDTDNALSADAALAPSDAPPTEIPPTAATPPPRRRRSLTPLIYLVCLVVLVGAGAWLWLNPELINGGATDRGSELVTLRQQVQDLATRVARLEAAPRPAAPIATQAAPVDLAPLERRLAALEQRPTAPPTPAGVSPSDLDAVRGQVSDDAQKLATLNQSLATLTARLQGTDSQTTAQLQALQGRVESTDRLSAQVSSLTARAARLTQLQAADAALAEGKPLGTIPDAPPAVARFALTPPPTEAALRRQFPDLAGRALAAAGPDTGDKPFLDRVWGRMQQVVTIRAGERVIVGNPAAATLATAQDALDAGDLAGAVATLRRLPADAAAPLAGWMDQAGALLAARAGLADLAARS